MLDLQSLNWVNGWCRVFTTPVSRKIWIKQTNLLFTDTDSLTYEIKSKDVYEKLFKRKHLFDFREYQSKMFDPTNNKVIGKMEDGDKGISLNDFVGLKPKLHSILPENNYESNAATGVNIAIEFNEYKDILFKKKITRQKMKRIPSKTHEIGTYEVNKISLSCYGDKRFIWDDDVHTLDYFHKVIAV